MWWLVLFQANRAYQLVRRLWLQEGRSKTACACHQSKTSRALLGSSCGSCQILLKPVPGKEKPSETTDLGKLKGLGRASTRKQARKVRVRSSAWLPAGPRHGRRRISRFLTCMKNNNAKPLKLLSVVLRHFLPQRHPRHLEQFWRLHRKRSSSKQFLRGNAQNADA